MTTARDRQLAVYAVATLFNDYPPLPESMHRWTLTGDATLARRIQRKGGNRWSAVPELAKILAAHCARERHVLEELEILVKHGASTDELQRFLQRALHNR